jgi:hypothetical protein
VSLFQRRDAQAQLFGITGAGDLISRDRMGTGRTARVTNDTALRHSAVWACLRLRAGLISSFPVDCYRMVNGLQVEMPKPPIFTNPSGGRMRWWEWMWATQWDLDRAGNTPINSSDNSMEWIESRGFSVAEIARFFDAPVDLIDGAPAGKSSVTYANITQRNLQLLVMALGPAVFRREQALFDLAPQQRFVKLNTDALLRMDPQTRTAVLAERIASRQLSPSEARALENLPPFTESQKQEFVDLFGQPGRPAPVAGGKPTPVPGDPNTDPNSGGSA